MEKPVANGRAEPAEQIKAVALRLFAERGIDGVTVREIANAAGQKNHAALTYNFGSKDTLIRELIVDGARAIDDRRNAWLDQSEADGGPHTVLEVMECLVRTSISPEMPPGSECYNRFLIGVQMSNRKMLTEVLGDRWNSGYQRCLRHIRRLMPDAPPASLNQRLVFMGAAIGGVLAARENELADRTRSHRMWSRDATLSHIAQSIAALVEQHGS